MNDRWEKQESVTDSAGWQGVARSKVSKQASNPGG